RGTAQGIESDRGDDHPRHLQCGRAERPHRGAGGRETGHRRPSGGSRTLPASLHRRLLPRTQRRKPAAIPCRVPLVMENRAHAIIAVSFLLVFSAGALLVYYWLADRQDEPLAYEIVTGQSVGGLAEQSEVRFKGLVVGHIAKLGFDPDDRSRVVMRLRLKRDAFVTHATYAVITMQGPSLLDNVQRSVVQSHALITHTDALVRDAQTPVRDAAKLEASIQALAQSSRQLSDKLGSQTVPGFDALSESLLRTSQQLDEILRELKAKPQSLIFGPPRRPPGPGEPGFGGSSKKDHRP